LTGHGIIGDDPVEMPNPFNDAQMATLQARVPLERLTSCLTTLMTRLCRLEGTDQGHPVSRPGFAMDLRTAALETKRLRLELVTNIDGLVAELETLAGRVEAGENMSSYDVTLPWERRRIPR
jgi:hypothetical protein